jgi:hypothetical protein
MAKNYRSSITGRFVSKEFSKKNPHTTIGEKIKKRRKRKSKS